MSLSSGIDSTSVLAFLPQVPLPPLAITFGSSTLPEMDERAVTRSLCAHFGLENVSIEADFVCAHGFDGERLVFPGSPYSSNVP
ncbi:MAG: hypothetical protein IPO66_01965 [Rhodanobacteraceae bacterium]|nr:hypothetical protein [Rhodanobacteraceae bacterium]